MPPKGINIKTNETIPQIVPIIISFFHLWLRNMKIKKQRITEEINENSKIGFHHLIR
jgi:hypothetical protein